MFRYSIFLIVLFITIVSFAQEKRIALVIGNANYVNVQALKNPVNDALLMKETFENLGFDVILDTNVETRKQLYQSIDNFKKQKENYSVGFIYYAGHAVQIDGKNYMLPTKESYDSEADVKYNGLDIEVFIDLLNDPIQNEINVLILDACRNNPFEERHTAESRSLIGLNGLAEIKNPPSGSIIAFSTAAGAKASDGKNSKNSPYCLSLAKNMQIEGITLTKVFGLVRRDVRLATGQIPAFYDQLEGRDFFLNKFNFFAEIEEIDSLIEIENYTLANEKVIKILTLDLTNKKGLLRKARIEYKQQGKDYNVANIKRISKFYPGDPEVYEYTARYYGHIGEYDSAIFEINQAINIDSLEPQYYYWRGKFLGGKGKKHIQGMLDNYNKMIELNSKNALSYSIRADFFIDFKNDKEKALSDLSKAIELDPKSIKFKYNRAYFYYSVIGDEKKALEDLHELLKIDSNHIKSLNLSGLIYQNQGNMQLAISQYSQGIRLKNIDPIAAADCYSNRALIYSQLGRLNDALIDFNEAITLDPNNAERYYVRADFYSDKKKDFKSAEFDLNNAIKIEPNNIDYLYFRGLLYEELKDVDKAIQDYKTILAFNQENIDARNNIGLIYYEQGNIDLAIEQYNEGIALELSSPTSAAYCYLNRAVIYTELGKLDEALLDYSKAIELNESTPGFYIDRAFFYCEKKNDNKRAYDDFSKAIELNPGDTVSWYFRGNFCFNYLKNNTRALQDFNELLKISPNNIDAINSIGLVYEDEGKIDLALAQYEKGIALKESSPESAAYCYNNRAEILSKKGKTAEALIDYNNAIELDFDNSERYYNRASFYQEFLNDYNQALIDYSIAIQLNPDDIENWYARALLYQHELSDLDAALKDGLQMLKLDSLSLNALNLCATIYMDKNELDSALILYNKGISLKSDDIESSVYCYLNRSDIYAKKGDMERALSDLNKALELDSKNSATYIERAWFMSEYLNQPENACKEIAKALENDNTNPDNYLMSAQLLRRIGDSKRQLKSLNESIKLAPETPIYLCERGLFYSQRGQFEKAQNDFKNAHLIDTLDYTVYHYLYKHYILKGELDSAIIAINSAIKIEPNDPEHYYNLAKIFERQGKNTLAIKNYALAEGLMTQDKYYLTDDNAEEIEAADVFLKVGEFYERINDMELMCEEYNKALDLIKNDNRHKYKKIREIIIEKLALNCR
jgi:tetratricopeptide (TPR) repeat protein